MRLQQHQPPQEQMMVAKEEREEKEEEEREACWFPPPPPPGGGAVSDAPGRPAAVVAMAVGSHQWHFTYPSWLTDQVYGVCVYVGGGLPQLQSPSRAYLSADQVVVGHFRCCCCWLVGGLRF